MIIEVKRTFKGPKYTIGHMYIDGKYFCDTMEDVDRGLDDLMSLEEIKSKKVYGETAIPQGIYTISMNTVSPKFKNRTWAKKYDGIVPRLLDVKGYDGVLIHPFNTAEESLGCIGVGFNKVKGKIINSTDTYLKLMEILTQAEDEIELHIF